MSEIMKPMSTILRNRPKIHYNSPFSLILSCSILALTSFEGSGLGCTDRGVGTGARLLISGIGVIALGGGAGAFFLSTETNSKQTKQTIGLCFIFLFCGAG